MIHLTEVDGVPTVLSPGPGPVHAGLTFRVGRVDERVARTGLCHLIEHLVLHDQDLDAGHVNGATTATMTVFHRHGEPADLADFLGSVCARLVDLPLDRMATEIRILRTEAAGRSTGLGAELPAVRYGAQGHGKLIYPEWGLHAVTPDEVREFARTYFTADNACLWISGADQVPTGLRIPLPRGERRPVPVPAPLIDAPAGYDTGSGVVAWENVVPRSSASVVSGSVMRRALLRRLRQTYGYSYHVDVNYEPYDDQLAAVTVSADALPEKADAMMGEFIDVLAQLQIRGPEPDDVDAAVRAVTSHLREPDADCGRLPGVAFDLLVGRPVETAADELQSRHAVTPGDVRGFLRDTQAGAVLLVPAGRRVDWAGYDRPAGGVVPRAEGTQCPAPWSGHGRRLIVGDQAVGLATDTAHATVRYQDCVAALCYPDGGRHLVGADGTYLRVEPTLYDVDASVLQELDSHLPPAVTVPMPARDPDDIPAPPPTDDDADETSDEVDAIPVHLREPLKGYAWEVLGLVVLAVVTALCALASFGFTAASLKDADDDAWIGWILTGLTYLITIGLTTTLVILLRRRTRLR